MASLNVELNQAAEFFGRFERFGGTKPLLKQLLADDDRMRSWVRSLMTKNDVAATTNETVTVPDLPAAELIALVQRSFKEAGIPFTYFNPDLEAWDFLLDERGKTFQVLMYNFGRNWETHEARAWQKSVGADGNVAAFIAWVIAKKPMGWFVSIPNDDARLWRHPVRGFLCAPRFYRDDDYRDFHLRDVQGQWGGGSSAVAFRAI